MKFFRCEKCGHQFMAADEVTQSNFKCGAIVEYLFAEEECANNDIIASMGIKPLGCGGKISEISLEEATAYVSEK